MGAETILSTILQLLFSVFAINENDQSALFYRVYKILSIIFVSFFIYRHKYGTFYFIQISKWNLDWFKTIEYSNSKYCLIYSMICFVLMKFLSKYIVKIIYNKINSKFFKTNKIISRNRNIISYFNFVRSKLIEFKYLRRVGKYLKFTQKGVKYKYIIKALNECFEQGKYDYSGFIYLFSTSIIFSIGSYYFSFWVLHLLSIIICVILFLASLLSFAINENIFFLKALIKNLNIKDELNRN